MYNIRSTKRADGRQHVLSSCLRQHMDSHFVRYSIPFSHALPFKLVASVDRTLVYILYRIVEYLVCFSTFDDDDDCDALMMFGYRRRWMCTHTIIMHKRTSNMQMMINFRFGHGINLQFY